MTKNFVTIITLVAALLAVAAPILFSISIAHREARDAEMSRVLAYARDVVHRSDSTADQIDAGIQKLTAMHAADPCSRESREAMEQIDVASSYLQAIGHVSGNIMECASVSTGNVKIDLGPPDVVQPTGVKIRSNVTLPFLPGSRFIVVERNGYAVIIHKDVPIDVTVDASDLALALVNRVNHQIFTSRGYYINPSWLDELHGRQEATFIVDNYVVAVAASQKYLFDGVAALPIAGLNDRTRAAIMVLAPVGIGAGVVLAIALLYLARMQLAMPAVIRAALKRDEFFVQYQPIVNLTTGRWVGAEALIRWRRQGGELVRPDVFIPAAEDSGLIQRITERALQLVVRDASGLFRKHPGFHLGLNLSPADMHSESTIALIRQVSRAMNARPGNLVIEVTERGFTKPELARNVLRALRDDGVRAAIDDFGTGYSSLSHLQSLELDYLKIDKAFVDTIGTEAATRSVVLHIIEMARNLGLEMIAEGVETQAQADYLREHGVQCAQGRLFSVPMDFSDLARKLARRA
jgi:sensor c-di-GMP phosphodiesterase-like protein